jgi:EAL domain-containing protein (putative c-di-GMP-specific phosphodiesterase class I)
MDEPRCPSVSVEQLRDAVANGELTLEYQPKLDLRSETVTGVEALARWSDRHSGSISPADFIPAIEKAGLIDWFSRWALTTAARHWAQWYSDGLDLELAVNISALNLGDLEFPDLVSAICEDHAVPPTQLTLELTEGATQDLTQLMDTVARIRLKGIGISLDDFGTGFGSLVQLRALPFTELKVDRRFVSDLLVSKDSQAITRGLIGIAHELGLTVTAEGVEDPLTLALLRGFECDKAQGFLIGPSIPGPQLVSWFAEGSGCGH